MLHRLSHYNSTVNWDLRFSRQHIYVIFLEPSQMLLRRFFFWGNMRVSMRWKNDLDKFIPDLGFNDCFTIITTGFNKSKPLIRGLCLYLLPDNGNGI